MATGSASIKTLPAATPTVRDIAKHAGVSIGTVSRALKGQGGLTEDTRQQVLGAAERLGYDLGRLRSVRPKRILVLMERKRGNITENPFYSPVLHGAEEACRSEGVALSYNTLAPGDNVAEILRIQEPHALLCIGSFETSLLQELRRGNYPLVLVDTYSDDFPSVNSDNLAGSYQLTQHLIALGKRRIAFLGGPPYYSIVQRLEGYRQALREAGLKNQAGLEFSASGEGVQLAYELAMNMLSSSNRPDAIVAYNDTFALTVLQVCQQLGLRVPHDVAVAGYDDIAASERSTPPLTTIRVDKEALGQEGVRLLLHPKVRQQPHVVVPVRLVVRESTRARS
jgi:LacI family transcriptional regulator, repressor for deo operon, udp, cdd, tsx, nupC, and nupG